MTSGFQPLDRKFAIVNADGTPNDYFIRWAQQKIINDTDFLEQLLEALGGDPDADRMIFWDDSEETFRFLAPGSNLSITDDVLNASGGGGGGGAAWTEVAHWDFPTDGAVASLVADVSAYDEALVVFRLVTATASTINAIQVSTDGGATFRTTSGDYVSISGNGVESNQVSALTHGTLSTAARSSTGIVRAMRSNRVKPIDCPSSSQYLFVQSTNPITHIRALRWVNTTTLADMSGGSVDIYGR